jgi:uncharacterized damage-inducible protein DinB
MSNEFGKAYLDWCRFRLMKHYWPRIQQCVAELTEEDIWWRAHETNNSVGNLLLHLTGNLQQFVLATIGGAQDTRNKDLEFAARDRTSKEILISELHRTLIESDRILAQFDPSRLLDLTKLQNRERPLLEVIAIVVEHFALHTGQIIYIMKLRTGKDLKL